MFLNESIIFYSQLLSQLLSMYPDQSTIHFVASIQIIPQISSTKLEGTNTKEQTTSLLFICYKIMIYLGDLGLSL